MPARTRQRPRPASPAPSASPASIAELQETHPDFLEWARRASREEFFDSLVRAGIYTRGGRLAKAWRPAPGEEPVLPLTWPKSAPSRRAAVPTRPARPARTKRASRKPAGGKAPAPRSKSTGARPAARRTRKA